MKSLHLTIDLDTLGCYRAIHGLDQEEQKDACPIYQDALPRFLELCDALDIRATLFVIGRDMLIPEQSALIRKAHRAGHEIASHSFSHNYALSRLPQRAIEDDLGQAEAAIEKVTGHTPVGFRAPGYNQSLALMNVLRRRGYLYDSSFLPVPLYYFARRSAIKLKKRRGKISHSLAGDLREFLAPKTPFRPRPLHYYRPENAPYSHGNVWEIPIAAPFSLPFIGTTIAIDQSPLTPLLARVLARQDGPAVLEFHGIDFLDPKYACDLLRGEQPDLRVSLDKKLERIKKVIMRLQESRPSTTLKALAKDLSGLKMVS